MSEPLVIPAPEGSPERFQPPASFAARPFWDATRECRLVVQWCLACEQPVHFPREACPRCLSTDLEFRPSPGLGTVYACSTMPVPGNPGMAGRTPYLVALIDLDDGVRMMSNVVGGGGPEAVVGDRVRVAWEPIADGRHLPVFVLATA